MAELYYTASRGDGTTLYIAPLTDAAIDACGQELPTSGGHFLYERSDNDPTDIRVIAHLVSEEAVFEMQRLLNLKWV
jgi:hypothetical protein